jgi:hypothetical protein
MSLYSESVEVDFVPVGSLGFGSRDFCRKNSHQLATIVGVKGTSYPVLRPGPTKSNKYIMHTPTIPDPLSARVPYCVHAASFGNDESCFQGNGF